MKFSCTLNIEMVRWDFAEMEFAEIMGYLETIVMNPDSSDQQKKSSMESIDRLCQDTKLDILKEHVDKILPVTCFAMNNVPIMPVKATASRVMLQSLEYSQSYLDDVKWRQYIVGGLIMTATRCTDTGVRVGAFKCLTRIACLYYPLMRRYMHPLFEIFWSARNDDPEWDIRRQALKFLSEVPF